MIPPASAVPAPEPVASVRGARRLPRLAVGLAVLAALGAGSAGCGPTAAKDAAHDASAQAASTEKAATADRATADRAGTDRAATLDALDTGWPRRVEVPGAEPWTLAAPPQRVVPAASGSVDLLCALLPPERIAALPTQALEYSNLDPDQPGWAARPRFDRYVAEALLSLQPDLVVAYALQSPATTEVLRGAGIPVLELPDPRDFAELCAQIRLLGRVTGQDAEAAALVADLERRAAVLAAGHAGRAGITALTYTNGGAGGWTAGAGTTQQELMRLAGLENAAARSGRTGHGRIDYEELLTLDPDVILVAGDDDGRSITAGLLEVEPALAGLRAVRDGAVVVLPGRLFSATSQALLTAAESVAAQVDAHLASRQAARASTSGGAPR